MSADVDDNDNESYYYSKKNEIGIKPIIICSICKSADNCCCNCMNNNEKRRNTTGSTTTKKTTSTDEMFTMEEFKFNSKPKKEKKRVAFIEDVEVPLLQLQPQQPMPQQPMPQCWQASAAAAKKHHVVGHHVVVGVVGNVCY